MDCSKGLLYGLLAAFFFACVAGISASFPQEVPVYQILVIQNGFALLFLAAFFHRGKIRFPPLSNKRLYLFRSGIGALSGFAFTASLKKINLLDATLLNMTAPFFLPVIGTLWLKEKAPWQIWPISLLGFYGASLIYPPSGEIFQTGALLALGSGFLTAISLCCLRKLHEKSEPPLRITLVMASLGLFLNGLPSLYHWHPMSVGEWWIGAAGGVLMGLNQLFLVKAFQKAPASSLGPMSYAVFPSAALINWLFYAKSIQLPTITGALLIAASGLLTYRIRHQTKPEATEPKA